MSKLIYLKKQETLRELIGRFVYLSYTPSRCGVIRSVWESDEKLGSGFGLKPHLLCLVEWLKTTKTYPDKLTTHTLIHLNDFEELMRDHKTK